MSEQKLKNVLSNYMTLNEASEYTGFSRMWIVKLTQVGRLHPITVHRRGTWYAISELDKVKRVSDE